MIFGKRMQETILFEVKIQIKKEQKPTILHVDFPPFEPIAIVHHLTIHRYFLTLYTGGAKRGPGPSVGQIFPSLVIGFSMSQTVCIVFLLLTFCGGCGNFILLVNFHFNLFFINMARTRVLVGGNECIEAPGTTMPSTHRKLVSNIYLIIL